MHITWEQFKEALPAVSAEELAANFRLVVDYDYYIGEPADGVEKSLELVKSAGLEAPQTWAEYVKAHYKPE
jgi:hypothetical protein